MADSLTLAGFIALVRSAAALESLAVIVGCALSAALLAKRDTLPRWVGALAVSVGAWWAAGGYRVAGQLIAALRPVGTGTPVPTALNASALLTVAACLIALGLRFAAPVWAGVFVGRRVTFGTGWASAAVIAASVAGALLALVG